MWIVCSVGVLLVLFQAIKFLGMAFKDGKEMGIERETLMSGVRASFISSIGPSIAILIGMLALIVNIGAPFAWMRLSFIGSVMYELMGADFGAIAVGTELGAPDYNALAFSSAVWTQSLGAIGWLLVCIFATDKLEIIRRKIAGKKVSFLPILTIAAMLGAFSNMTSKHLIKGGASTAAVITGMVVMIFLIKIADSSKKHWIKEWALGISMISGMIVSSIF
jgi:hypothetical protein